MEKKYKEIEFLCNCTIVEAVLELVKHGSNGEFVCGSFRGHMLYSDTVSLNSAYLEIAGKTYFDRLNEREQTRQRLIKEEDEYQKTVPDQIKVWIEDGHKVIDEKYWNDWDKLCSSQDFKLISYGILISCLNIIKHLNEGCSLIEAKNIIDSQDHSNMSFGLVRNIVREYCDRGPEFADYLR